MPIVSVFSILFLNTSDLIETFTIKCMLRFLVDTITVQKALTNIIGHAATFEFYPRIFEFKHSLLTHNKLL